MLYIQLPSRVTELGTSLAQVEVKNLDSRESASRGRIAASTDNKGAPQLHSSRHQVEHTKGISSRAKQRIAAERRAAA